MRFSSKPFGVTQYGEFGKYYYGYRFYDPNTQRWLNRDPLGERADINLYRPFLNNAIIYFDPLGLTVRFAGNAGSEFIGHWRKCFCVMASGGPVGATLAAAAAGPTTDIIIAPNPLGAGIGSASEGEVAFVTDPPIMSGTVVIYLNPNQVNGTGPIINTWPDEMPPNTLAGCAVTLAHELGHALYATDDEGPYGTGDGSNVSNYENPVRREQGLEPREYYHGLPIAFP